MRVFQVSFSIIEEAETAEDAVTQVLMHYDIAERLEVEDITEEFEQRNTLYPQPYPREEQ